MIPLNNLLRELQSDHLSENALIHRCNVFIMGHQVCGQLWLLCILVTLLKGSIGVQLFLYAISVYLADLSSNRISP